MRRARQERELDGGYLNLSNPQYQQTFKSKAERTGFIQAIYTTLPRELSDPIYEKMVEDENNLYCIRLPQVTYSDKNAQPALMASYPPLLAIGSRGSIFREKLAQNFFGKNLYYIVHPHIGLLDDFILADIFFGTHVVPGHHIKDPIFDIGCLTEPDPQGNRWMTVFRSRHRRARYSAMWEFSDRRERGYGETMSKPPGICKIEVWTALLESSGL
jgi:hypothetical protein